MKNIKFSRLFAAFSFVAILTLAGCKPVTEEVIKEVEVTTEKEVEKTIVIGPISPNDGIIGEWLDNYTNYNNYNFTDEDPDNDYDCKITANKIETASWGVHNGPVFIKKLSETSGYLYYQLENDLPDYSTTPAGTISGTAGKWFATAYKNLTDDSVNMCDAYKDFDLPADLYTAIETYTVANGWFDYLDTTEFIKVTE